MNNTKHNAVSVLIIAIVAIIIGLISGSITFMLVGFALFVLTVVLAVLSNYFL